MSKIVALTAPSGSGKTTIARAALKAIPELRFSVSATTRPPRNGETDGVHYHFVTEGQFRQYINEGNLIEYEEVYPGQFYGTLRSEVERGPENNPVLLDIDVQGALRVKELYGDDALAIFIRPPSVDVLKERLHKRATETDESLRTRLAKATHELAFADRFDAVVVNDTLDHAIDETLHHIRTFLDA